MTQNASATGPSPRARAAARRAARAWLAIALLAAAIAGGVWFVRAREKRAALDDALYRAVLTGDVSRADTLLTRGANPNAPHVIRFDASRGETVADRLSRLWRRVRFGERAPQNHFVEYPLTLATNLPRTPMGDLDKSSGAQLALIALLARRGADVDAVGTGGTALYHATEADDIPAAIALIKAGARADTPNPPHNATALHLAAKNRQVRIARLLLTQGRASPDARDAFGATALHYAVSGGFAPGERGAILRVLLDHGARPDLRDKRGRTARDLATAHAARYNPATPGGAPYARAALILKRAEDRAAPAPAVN